MEALERRETDDVTGAATTLSQGDERIQLSGDIDLQPEGTSAARDPTPDELTEVTATTRAFLYSMHDELKSAKENTWNQATTQVENLLIQQPLQPTNQEILQVEQDENASRRPTAALN